MQFIDLSEPTAAERRVFFTCKNSSGTGIPGLGGSTAYVSARGGGPFTATLVEVDPTNMRGLYYVEPSVAQVGATGAYALHFQNASIVDADVEFMVVNRLTIQDVAEAVALAVASSPAAGSTLELLNALTTNLAAVLTDTAELQTDLADGGRNNLLLKAGDITDHLSQLLHYNLGSWYGVVTSAVLDNGQFSAQVFDGDGTNISAQVTTTEQLRDKNFFFDQNTGTIVLRGQGTRIISATSHSTYVIVTLPVDKQLSRPPVAGDIVRFSVF